MSAPESSRRRFEKPQPVEIVEVTTETTGTVPAEVLQVDGTTGTVTPVVQNTSGSGGATAFKYTVSGKPSVLTIKCDKCGTVLAEYSGGCVMGISEPLVIKCKCHG
jgi:hypothetical protein